MKEHTNDGYIENDITEIKEDTIIDDNSKQ